MSAILKLKVKTKINLYLLGIKGLKVLKFIILKNYFNQINLVIIGKDKNIDNDFSNNIKDLCQLNHIKFVLCKLYCFNTKSVEILLILVIIFLQDLIEIKILN